MSRPSILVMMVAALLCQGVDGATAQPSAPSQVTYKYDALGRLIEVRYPNGRVVTYSYDPAGNRTTVTVGS